MWTETIPVSGVVGEVVSIGGSLNIVAGGSASPDHFASGSGVIDALDTGFFYADPVTSGLELVSASGHGYASPGVGAPTVPEPSAWLTMLLGFAGLGFAGYRASRQSGKDGRVSRTM
jgi:PEP-CTERM motif